MAGRVNTKFVVTLSAVLVLVFGGVLGAALWIRLHNAPDLAAKGDAKMLSGDAKQKAGDIDGAQLEYEAAEKFFSKTVNKEQSNPAYLQKWVEALGKWVPETQARTNDRFRQSLVPAVRQLAIAKKTDVKAHRDYLELLYRSNKTQFSRTNAEYLISEVDRSLLLFRGDPQENAGAQALRRYRGLIVTLMMSVPGTELTPAQMDAAKDDLVAAFQADPTDSETGVALLDWYNARMRMAKTDNKEELAADFEKKAHESIDTYVAAHPDDALGVIRKLGFDLYIGRTAIEEQIMRAPAPTAAATTPAQPVKSAADRLLEAEKELAKKLTPAFEHAATLLRTQAADMSMETLGSFQQIEGFFDALAGPPAPGETRTALARTRDAYAAVIKAHPKSPDAYIALAQLKSSDKTIDEAMALLQTVVDMPRPPVSLDAVLLYDHKSTALFYQSVYAFQEWENENGRTPRDEKKAKALLEASRKYRADVAQYVGNDLDRLKFIDGLHKFADGDWLGAKKLLTDYVKTFRGVNIKAEWTLAQCELRLNNTGAALGCLERIISVRPDIEGPIVQRAALYYQLGRTEEAVRSLEGYLNFNPTSGPAKEQLNRMRIASGDAKPTDPLEATLFRAQQLLDGVGDAPADPKAAAAVIEEALQTNSDIRLHRALAMIRGTMNDREGAIAAAKAGLAVSPDNAELQRMVDGLSQTDPIAWRLKLIAEAKDLTDTDKALSRYVLMSSVAQNTMATGNVEKAKQEEAAGNAALDEALKLSPDDQRVVDRVFSRAMSTSDWATCEKMIATAAAKDFDKAGGASYKGRLLYARGQLNEAAATLRELADKGIADVASLRLLAVLYQRQGRTDDAETYFKEALKLRPGDAMTLITYLNLLSTTGRVPEALAKAKESEPAARTNAEFMNVLLSLEAAVGNVGGENGALARREKIKKKDPGNFVNTLALIGLYIDAKRWGDARTTLDELRKLGDGTDLVLAEARFYAEQNKFEDVQRAFDEFIARQDPKRLDSDVFISLAQFLVAQKRYPEAYAFMERGKPYQDPKVMEVDRAAGEMLVTIGQPDNAVIVFKRVVDAGADGPGQEVRIRLAELYTALTPPQFKEAQQQLDQVTSHPEAAAQIMLIRADVAQGLGDAKKAAEFFNQAVAQFPNDPLVYFRRGQWYLLKGAAGIKESLADLDAAIRVRPTFWQAYRLRSFVYFGSNPPRLEEAIADVKETLRINPSLDDLRLQLLRELITRDRAAEAGQVADAAVKLRPNDVPLAMSIGLVFAQNQDWSRAVSYYKLGWARAQRPDVAQTLLNAILNSENPDLSAADEILKHDAIKNEILKNSGLLLGRAKLLSKRNRPADALKDMLASTVVVPRSAEAIGAWFQEIRRLLPRSADVLGLLERRDLPPAFKDWATYLRAQVMIENPASRAQAVTLLDGLLASSKESDLRTMSSRLRGTIEYMDGKYDGAEKIWRKALEEFPDDWEMNNNEAYVLSRHLNRAKDAIPFAEAAVKLAPSSAEAADTLGYVYSLSGRLEDAANQLRRANNLAKGNDIKASVHLHLARCLLDLNKKDDAQVQMDALRKLFEREPKLEKDNQAEFDDLKRRMGSP